MGANCRQHYNLATGGALAATDSSKKVIKYAKGGSVKSGYLTQTDMNGKVVARDNPNSGRGRVKGGGKAPMNPSRLSGDDKFTSITHKKAHLAKGFKVQKP